MKRIHVFFTLLALLLSACGPTLAPNTEEMVPVENQMPVPGITVTEMVVEPQGKVIAPSFESQTYVNDSVGFALEYPAGWTVTETVIGPRGSEVLFLSSPEIAQLAVVPEGETSFSIAIYQWEPKDDLAAFVEVRKKAWEASGFKILSEEALTLDLGLPAMKFMIEAPDGTPSVLLFAALSGNYLALSGLGDLVLAQEIMQYLRPVSGT